MLEGLLALLIGYGSEKANDIRAVNDYYARKKKLAAMDPWDAAEYQIKEKAGNLVTYFVKESIECKGQQIRINLLDVEANRRYEKSGLSMEEFAKNLFSERYKTQGENIWRGCASEADTEINLYDENMKKYRFRIHNSYKDKNYLVMTYYKNDNLDSRTEVEILK